MPLAKSTVNKRAFEELRKEDCNLAQVYVVWVDVFDKDCTVQQLHKYLLRRFDWTPSYYTLRYRWMPRVRKHEEDAYMRGAANIAS